MGFFGDVKNSLTETGQGLTQKAKDTTEIYRLNSLNKDKEKEIDQAAVQIGMQYYSNFKEECEAKFPELAGQIMKLQQEIADNKQMIEKISSENVRKCPACGNKIEEGQAFCTNCGTRIEENKEAKTEVKKEVMKNVCKNCGAEIAEGDRFCIHCGTPVENN